MLVQQGFMELSVRLDALESRVRDVHESTKELKAISERQSRPSDLPCENGGAAPGCSSSSVAPPPAGGKDLLKRLNRGRLMQRDDDDAEEEPHRDTRKRALQRFDWILREVPARR